MPDLPIAIDCCGVSTAVIVRRHPRLAFYTWGGHEAGTINGVGGAGEGAPAWAPDAQVEDVLNASATVEHLPHGTRWRQRTGATQTLLELHRVGERREFSLEIANPRWDVALPVCGVELRFAGLELGDGACWLCPPVIGAGSFGEGLLAEVPAVGVTFHPSGVVGMDLPLLALGDNAGGLLWEVLSGDRPHLHLLPGAKPGTVDLVVLWHLSRRLQPGQVHRLGGHIGVVGYSGDPIAAFRAWRDAAGERFGLRPPAPPSWVRGGAIIEWNFNPDQRVHGVTRLDEAGTLALAQRWRDCGYTAIYGVSCNRVGPGGWLSPVDYTPRDEVGGAAAERSFLDYVHELGLHAFLWVTTVGIDRHVPVVAAQPDWWTHRADGKPYYAWGASDLPDQVGYAPDGDPGSTGWCRWLDVQVREVVARGWDGVFIDGILPRSDNHLRRDWPGEARNGVEGQVRDLATTLATLDPELICFPEDSSLMAQTIGHLVVGSYDSLPPTWKRDHFHHDFSGSGGKPKRRLSTPQRIPPERVADWLRLRAACRLPGTLWSDMVEGYVGEATRPWILHSVLSGSVIKTHGWFIHDPAVFTPICEDIPVPEPERAPAWRQRGLDEFFTLLRLGRDEPLIRQAPLSYAVTISGDAAVVGMMKPSPTRCLLVLFQFAPRTARVGVALAPPDDVPTVERAACGEPQVRSWRVRELHRSMVDDDTMQEQLLPPGGVLKVDLAPYGFRLLELA